MAEPVSAAAPAVPTKKSSSKKPKKEKRHVVHGVAHIHASFNNTHVTITDMEGHVVTCRACPRSTRSRRALPCP